MPKPSGTGSSRARWYDPALGRFIQPDTIVPEPGNPQALNRYSYCLNNPVRYSDPTGYDPLDKEWESQFKKNNGRNPTDFDRQMRLYSLIYSGPVSGSHNWTDEDWAVLGSMDIGKLFGSTEGREGLDDFANAVQRLSIHYTRDEQGEFVSAIALLYAGVPYTPWNLLQIIRHGFGGASQLSYLNHGMKGFHPMYYRRGKDGAPEENTHHYAGHLLASYYLPWEVNVVGTLAREGMQGVQNELNVDIADINMGFVSTGHGQVLRIGWQPQALHLLIRQMGW